MSDTLERTHTMPDDARAIETLPAVSGDLEAQLQHEDAGIKRAAIALCWAARPVLAGAPPPEITPLGWWNRHSELDQRLHLYRARVAIDAWENADAI